jgi:NADH-quinone oxidoreductase subunit L
MFRLLALTFQGEPRWEKGVHPHEAPATMTVPLVILAVLAAIGGFAGIPRSLGGSNAFEQWLEPVFAPAADKLAAGAPEGEIAEYVLMGLSVAAALSGLYLARRWYLKKPDVPGLLVKKFPGVYRLLLNKYYVDEIYDASVVRPALKGSETILWKGIDVHVIDATVNGIARITAAAGRAFRLIQTGVVQTYVLVFLAGAVLLVGWLLAK